MSADGGGGGDELEAPAKHRHKNVTKKKGRELWLHQPTVAALILFWPRALVPWSH